MKLSAAQAGKRLGLKRSRIQQLRAAGILKGERTTLGYLYSEAEVRRVERARAKKKGGRR